MLLSIITLSLVAWAHAAYDENREAFVIVAATQSELVRALVVARSLRDVKTKKEVVLLVNGNSISDHMRTFVKAEFSEVKEVELPQDMVPKEHQLVAAARPDILRSLIAIYAWRLTHFQKVVLLAQNVLLIRNSDELMQEPSVSAVPDKALDGESIFDASVVVLEPSVAHFNRLMDIMRRSNYTWNDESVLNSGFPKWNQLSDDYCSPELVYLADGSQESGIGYSSKIVEMFDELPPWMSLYTPATKELITGNKIPDLSARRRWWELFTTLQADFAESMKSTEQVNYETKEPVYDTTVEQEAYETTEKMIKDEAPPYETTETPKGYPDANAAGRLDKAKRSVAKRVRKRRGSSCNAECPKGICSCDNYCSCYCNWMGKAVCS